MPGEVGAAGVDPHTMINGQERLTVTAQHLIDVLQVIPVKRLILGCGGTAVHMQPVPHPDPLSDRFPSSIIHPRVRGLACAGSTTTPGRNDKCVGYPKPQRVFGVGTAGGNTVTVSAVTLSHVYKTLSK